MKANNLFEKFVSDRENQKILNQEELMLDITERICELMESEGVSRQDLAACMGKSKGFISQLLNGGRNLTLKTIADLALAMGYKVQFKFFREFALQKETKITHFPNAHKFYEFESSEADDYVVNKRKLDQVAG